MILYKYRGFENLEFALDIFVHQRLYAANFKRLNDPMEGRFVYSRGTMTSDTLREIRGSKSELNILSLSETDRNMLMWSYYGAGHSGFAVGVEIAEDAPPAESVTYVDDLALDLDPVASPADRTRRNLLHKIAERFCPGVEVVALTFDQLDTGDADPYEI